MNVLDDWIDRVVTAFGLGECWTAADRDVLLELSRDVAHGVARPAAPVTAYLVGLAVGRGVGPPGAVAARVRALAAAGAGPADSVPP